MIGLKLTEGVKEWINREALRQFANVDFQPCADAPDDFPQLCQGGRDPIHVSLGFTGGVCWREPIIHQMVRAWHDLNHLKTGLDFGVEQEVELAQLQSNMVDSEVLALALWIDFGEQTIYRGKFGDFPPDSQKFFADEWKRLTKT